MLAAPVGAAYGTASSARSFDRVALLLPPSHHGEKLEATYDSFSAPIRPARLGPPARIAPVIHRLAAGCEVQDPIGHHGRYG